MLIRIVTDTACDLPLSLLREYRIRAVASSVVLDGQALAADHHLDGEEFYRRLEQVKEPPQAIDVTVESLSSAYADLLAEDPECTIISIHLSGEMARTMQNAREAAARFPDARIRIVDSRQVSVAQGLMVLEAARRAAQGASEAAILQRLTQMSSHVRSFVLLDTLEYLALTGRVSGLERFFGALVGIRPILKIESGEVLPHQNIVTRGRGLNALRDIALWSMDEQADLRLSIGHARCRADADWLADQLRQRLSISDLSIMEFGPGIGVATGPGALGFAWASG